MSVMVATGLGAKNGVLVKEARALEALEKIDTFIFDKTGTLTKGKPAVKRVILFKDKYAEIEILSLVYGLEQHSSHPMAQAIKTAAEKYGAQPAQIRNFKNIPGKGIIAEFEGKPIAFGNEKLMKEYGADISYVSVKTAELKSTGQSVMFLSAENKVIAAISAADELKENAAGIVAQLRKNGIETIMLTGDNKKTAEAAAKEAGVDYTAAELLPEEKQNFIKKLKEDGKKTAMAGDGINDAAALVSADVGIAMETGTDIAVESADITLISGNLAGITKAFNLSRLMMKNIRQNLFLAFAYNILAVPVAAGLLYPFTGILLSPEIASLAMALSSVSVIGNALRISKAEI